MSKTTPPGPAGALNETVNVNDVVPALPSFKDTSLTVKDGRVVVNGVSEKSSMARPSSAPVASSSAQRIQNSAPAGIDSDEIVALSTVLSAAALPFFAPAVTVSGVTKS